MANRKRLITDARTTVVGTHGFPGQIRLSFRRTGERYNVKSQLSRHYSMSRPRGKNSSETDRG